MAAGTVTEFDDPKGWGTVTTDDGAELFFHCSTISGRHADDPGGCCGRLRRGPRPSRPLGGRGHHAALSDAARARCQAREPHRRPRRSAGLWGPERGRPSVIGG